MQECVLQILTFPTDENPLTSDGANLHRTQQTALLQKNSPLGASVMINQQR